MWPESNTCHHTPLCISLKQRHLRKVSDEGTADTSTRMHVNTTADFPFNFICSVSFSEIAGWLHFPDASGVCSHCSGLWQHRRFLSASCTDPDGAHNWLQCSYHACHCARREQKKEEKARGALRTTSGVSQLAWKGPIFNRSWWQKKRNICCSLLIIAGGGGNWILFFLMKMLCSCYW